MNANSCAKDVLERHWDGTLPVPLVSIAKKMGIVVYRQKGLTYSGQISLLDEPDEDGERVEIIFNADEPVVRQRFTIAHEIGHFALGHLDASKTRLLRDTSGAFNTVEFDPIEAQANKFAAALLMPSEEVKALFFGKGSKNVDEMASLFKVSSVAMRYRLVKLGLIHS